MPAPVSLRPLSAAVFDFDGTLAELTLDFDLMRRELERVAAGFFPAPPLAGDQPVLEWVEGLSHTLERDVAARFTAAAAQRIQELEMEAAAAGSLFPFTKPLLTGLRNAGVGVGVITRNCGPAVEVAFPDWRDFSAHLLPREYGGPTKPNPEHLHRALDLLQSPPERSLMVGDHPMDIATGKAAGAMTAGVASGRVSLDDLAAAGADLVAPNSHDLWEMLKKKRLIPV